MAKSRIELHELLVSTLGSRYVYFQPPESIKLKYPCIIYNLENYDVKNADDVKYSIKKRYSITVIDLDPDSNISDKILSLPLCSFDRFYTMDNLNHYVFSIYY